MSYKEIDGDLLQLAALGNFDYFGHGCNCKRIMGSGIAGQISKLYPEMSNKDKVTKNNILGEIEVVKLMKNSNFFFGVNMYTQPFPGNCASYGALNDCLIKLNNIAKGKRVGLPEIGCGIGGLDFQIVRQLVQVAMKDCHVTLVHYK